MALVAFLISEAANRLTGRNLGEEGFILIHNLRIQFILVANSQWQETQLRPREFGHTQVDHEAEKGDRTRKGAVNLQQPIPSIRSHLLNVPTTLKIVLPSRPHIQTEEPMENISHSN